MKQNIYDHPIFYKKYAQLRESGITYNDFVEQPAIKTALPSLENKTVLDLGCGTGQFSKYCIENGASKVTAIDISKNMIHQAEIMNPHKNIEYKCIAMEDAAFPNETFDLIVSSLAVHYIEDYAAFIKQIKGFLKYNGEFIFSTEHPMVTARKKMNNWAKDHEGNRLYWTLDNYQEEGKREQHWYIDGVIKYHRTISTLINTLIKNGLILEKVIEPQPISLGLEKMPKLINEQRRPSFIILKSKKGERTAF